MRNMRFFRIRTCAETTFENRFVTSTKSLFLPTSFALVIHVGQPLFLSQPVKAQDRSPRSGGFKWFRGLPKGMSLVRTSGLTNISKE